MKIIKQRMRGPAETIAEGRFETSFLQELEEFDPIGVLTRPADEKGDKSCAEVIGDPSPSAIGNIPYVFSLPKAAHRTKLPSHDLFQVAGAHSLLS